MRRFQFRLERFLELRRWKEREWELALAKVLGECLLLERRIAEIAAEVSASFLSEFRTGRSIDIDSMMRRELYVQRLGRERERTQTALTEKRVEMEKVREKYLEAAKARKVLDKLKDRQAAASYERQIDEEFKTIDEINTAAATRGTWGRNDPS
jgi:flagellar protein FliJ